MALSASAALALMSTPLLLVVRGKAASMPTKGFTTGEGMANPAFTRAHTRLYVVLSPTPEKVAESR